MASSQSSSEPPSGGSSTPTTRGGSNSQRGPALNKIGASAHDREPAFQRRVEVYARVRPPLGKTPQRNHPKEVEEQELPYRIHGKRQRLLLERAFLMFYRSPQHFISSFFLLLLFPWQKVMMERPNMSNLWLLGRKCKTLWTTTPAASCSRLTG